MVGEPLDPHAIAGRLKVRSARRWVQGMRRLGATAGLHRDDAPSPWSAKVSLTGLDGLLLHRSRGS